MEILVRKKKKFSMARTVPELMKAAAAQ